MFGSRGIEIDAITVFVVIVSVAVLATQLLLCYKVKKVLYKLVPVIVLTISAITFYIFSVCIGGWDGIGLLFFALFSFSLLVICGIAWAIWAIIR